MCGFIGLQQSNTIAMPDIPALQFLERIDVMFIFIWGFFFTLMIRLGWGIRRDKMALVLLGAVFVFLVATQFAPQLRYQLASR